MASPSWIEGPCDFSTSTAVTDKGHQELGLSQGIANTITVLPIERTSSLIALPSHLPQTRIVRRHRWKHAHANSRADARHPVPVFSPDIQPSQNPLLASLGSRRGRTQGHCGTWTLESDLHSGPVEGHSEQDSRGFDFNRPAAYLVPCYESVVCRR